MSQLKLDTPLHAWVYLNRVIEGPSRALHALVQEYSVEDIALGVYKGESWLGELRDQTASRRDWLRQDEDLEIAARCGARLITPDSTEWPAEEFNRAFGFYQHAGADAPASFDAEAAPPHALWVRGGSLREAVSQSVAIVGTRAISRYGFDATGALVHGLVNHQWTIVSGGALGVDTAAHQAALDEGGTTVAIAACGIDQKYPARNGKMFDRIVDAGGVLVSEFPPGAAPQRHRFLTRNRLTAALTSGTVIVEAAYRSGALNTANWADALGKVVMAVPGPITTVGSLGCHKRIQDARAQLVTSADDVRELVGRAGDVDPGAQLEMNFGPSPVQRLSRNELKVFDSTPLPSDGGGTAADIARAAGMRVPLVIHLLVALEKQQLVVRRGALWERVDDQLG